VIGTLCRFFFSTVVPGGMLAIWSLSAKIGVG
jgi:hypothetical protein